ncbi:MAG: right-handed parallel beta-helix repeat-containing protein [Planctomycetes bacterium]|nr:right-handed parallel beta-helix repeat-containing protein [Planctomycetota bacterium]
MGDIHTRIGRMSTPAILIFLAAAICIQVFPAAAEAETYYVANSGDDMNGGTSPWQAFRTLNRAALAVRDGDAVLLRRGDVFREFADFRGKTLSLGSFGPDHLPMPVIAGSVVLKDWQPYYPKPSVHDELLEKLNGIFLPNQSPLVTCGLTVQAGSGPMKGWKVHKTSIYVASAGDQKVENLFVDGKMMLIARFPNAGAGPASWLRLKDGSNNNTIVDDGGLARHPRNAADYWKGANVRWRRWSWYFENHNVTGYEASGRLSLGGKVYIGDIAPRPGWGYYIDGKLEELDAPGEWFFDPNEKKVYLWAPNGEDPNKLLVEAACIANGPSMSGKVEGIEFRHQTDTGLTVGRSTVVTGCKFAGIGDIGLRGGWDASGSKITNCTFEDILNNSISWNENNATASGTEIAHNTLLRCGMAPGYGGSGPWHSCGIVISNGKGIKIHHNYFEDVGYVGILLGKEGNFAEFNIIKHAMATLNDGGAIYTNCDRSTIRNNIILDSEGNLESSGPWANLGQGIWPEFLNDFKLSVIENNTVAGSGCFGIFLPNNYDCTISGNVLYNNGKAQLELSGKRDSNHKIEQNIFYCCNDKQAAIQFRESINYGSLKGNYVCNPFTDSPIAQGRNAGRMSIREWQGKFSWADKEAKTDVVRNPQVPVGLGYLFINDTSESKDVPLPKAQWGDLDGKPMKEASIKLEPYSSKVLILGSGISGPMPKYYIYSEMMKAGMTAPKPVAVSKPPATNPGGTSVAVAKPEEKPKPPVTTEKLATMEDWVAKLKFRLGLYLKSGQAPKFRCQAVDAKVTVEAMDGSGQLTLVDRDGKKISLAWDKLTIDDYIGLAQDMAGMTDTALDHALLAYFCHAAKKTDKAQEHLKKAGSYEKAVRDATGM